METLKLISRRKDGVWELRDQEGVVFALCGKRPTQLWFQWALLMEARKQTALLEKLETHLDGISRAVENQPDFAKLLEQLTERAGQLQ